MRFQIFKILTRTSFSLGILFLPSLLLASVNQEQFKTHLRWNLIASKDQAIIHKNQNQLIIETIDRKFFDQLKKSLSSLKLDSQYIKKIVSDTSGYPEKPYTFNITLGGHEVELFYFYREPDKKYILDFWRSKQSGAKVSPTMKVETKKQLRPRQKIVKAKPANQKKATIKKQQPLRAKRKIDKDYRDFRYGAAHIWNYPALIPDLEEEVIITRKTPEFFYPIKDREYDKDKKESHMQLSINLFRKKRWGLMYKSIQLFERDYKDSKNMSEYTELNEYMKACSILRKNFDKIEQGPRKAAVRLLEDLTSNTENYQLKTAINRWLILYYQKLKNHISTLDYAKRLYVDTMTNFDREISDYAARVIMNTLAKLDQISKLNEFIEDRSVAKLVSEWERTSYRLYTLLKLNKYNEVINLYEKKINGYKGKLPPSVLYNVGEAYFRASNYKKAIETLDLFIREHSYHTNTSHSRLRIALSYDILERDMKIVKRLYLDAINKSTDPTIRYEAKVRYVGITNARAYKPTEKEKESIIFLEREKSELQSITPDMRRILWLVRLRSLINSENLTAALSYLQAIPTISMKPAVRRTFEGDGAEVVFGLIKQFYNVGKYTQAAKVWETYREKYTTKVAYDPEANFIIAFCYQSLGLNESYTKTLKELELLKSSELRSFPIWVKRDEQRVDPKILVAELKILANIKDKNWDAISSKLSSIDKDKFPKFYFYKGLAEFKKESYESAVASFEKYLVAKKDHSDLNSEEMALLFGNYTESLYRKNDIERYKKVTKAIIKDLKNHKTESRAVKDAIERMSYLLIEVIFAENNDSGFMQVEYLAKKYLKETPEGDFKSRVSYLLGASLIKNKKEVEGVNLLNNLINNTEVPGFIKELCRSELSAHKLEQKTL